MVFLIIILNYLSFFNVTSLFFKKTSFFITYYNSDTRQIYYRRRIMFSVFCIRLCYYKLSVFAVQIGLSSIYIVMVYLITGQPMEWERAIKFSVICLMIAIVSECFGLAIASRLNIVVSNVVQDRCRR